VGLSVYFTKPYECAGYYIGERSMQPVQSMVAAAGTKKPVFKVSEFQCF
jgi:hypothetical protein